MRYKLTTMLAGLALAGLSAPGLAADGDLSEICGACQPVKVATCGGFLEGVAVSPKGQLWVLDVQGDRIMTVDEEAGTCETVASAGGHPNGAKFTAEGQLLIATRSTLLSLDPETHEITRDIATYAGKPVTGLNDLALDPRGGIYLTAPTADGALSGALRATGEVYYIPPGESEAVLFAEAVEFPNGIAVSPDGNSVILSEFGAKRLISAPAIGATGGTPLAITMAYTTGGDGIDGMVTDEAGRILGANIGGGEVQVFAPNGTLLGQIELPADAGPLTTNLTIAKGAIYIAEAAKGEIWKVGLAE